LQREKWGAWAQRPPEIPAGEISERLETEVLVVGAGIAGLSCALSAAEGGAKVTVLEKLSHYTARGFNIGVVNSSLMRSRGIVNDPDAVAREWIKRCGNRCDEKIVRLFVDNSEPAMDWLLEILTRPEYGVRPEINGCVYKGETYREIYGTHIFYDGPISRQGRFGGMNDVLECMYRECLRLGVKFVFNAPMLMLTKDGERVTGAVARRTGGEYTAVSASRAVVLATGGIGGNDDMCADLSPLANKVAAKICGPKGCDNGDGHRAALWAGAAFEDGPFPTMMHPQAVRHASYCFLFVDKRGERFMNEDSYLQGRSLGVIKTGEKYAWSVFDSAWREKIPATLPYGGGLYWGEDFPLGVRPEFNPEFVEDKIKWGLETGAAVMADTPEELAEKMGVPADKFRQTFERYNAFCAAGRDGEFGKRKELLIPLDTPPYIARRFGPALLSVVGGVKCDTSMRALREDGSIVDGLYVLGNTAGGRYGVDYPMLLPGNSHGTALTFGWLLGRGLAGEEAF